MSVCVLSVLVLELQGFWRLSQRTHERACDLGALEINIVPRDIKMSSSLCYGRTQNRENHVTVFSHNTKKRTF
jgi:hypothetical protein